MAAARKERPCDKLLRVHVSFSASKISSAALRVSCQEKEEGHGYPGYLSVARGFSLASEHRRRSHFEVQSQRHFLMCAKTKTRRFCLFLVLASRTDELPSPPPKSASVPFALTAAAYRNRASTEY